MNRLKEFLIYVRYFLRNARFVLAYKIFRILPRVDRFGKVKQITLKSSDDVLKLRIASGKSFAAIRFGAVEMSALNNYVKIKLGLRRSYKKSVRYSMKNNAGFFPTTTDNLNYYATYMLKQIGQTDILGISGVHMEDYFHRYYCPQAVPIQYWAFEPLLGSWSPLLKGKKVLVISPFAKQIEEQYKRRKELFTGRPEILPEFTLKTVEAVQTLGKEADPRFSNWFEALDYMKVEVLKHDFDIALVGCGAYGSALCLFIKGLKKQAIQTGGATQLLFGLMGKRWENREHVVKHVTSSWTRPTQIPQGSDEVEKGCYW